MRFSPLSHLLLCTKTHRDEQGVHNGNHVWHVLICIWVFSIQKCEAVIFPKFESACMHARPLRYLDVLFLHRAHVPCMHTCDVHARCDITRVHI